MPQGILQGRWYWDGHKRRDKSSPWRKVKYRERKQYMSRLKGERRWKCSVVLLRSGLTVGLAFLYPSSFCPRPRIMLGFLYFHRCRGPRLSCIAWACLTSYFMLRLCSLVVGLSLMNQSWPLRCTRMVLNSIFGDGLLIEALKGWLIRPSYLRHFRSSEKKGQLSKWDSQRQAPKAFSS